VPRRTLPTVPLLRFIGVLLRHRYPRTVPAMAAAAGVSRATGYRYVQEIERLAVMPLRREPDPQCRKGRGELVGVDWSAMQGQR
jgi:hypothetical protein